jgi:hypothetical protein
MASRRAEREALGVPGRRDRASGCVRLSRQIVWVWIGPPPGGGCAPSAPRTAESATVCRQRPRNRPGRLFRLFGLPSCCIALAPAPRFRQTIELVTTADRSRAPEPRLYLRCFLQAPAALHARPKRLRRAGDPSVRDFVGSSAVPSKQQIRISAFNRNLQAPLGAKRRKRRRPHRQVRAPARLMCS